MEGAIPQLGLPNSLGWTTSSGLPGGSHYFTDEMLRAVVGVGQFEEPESEQMLAEFLIERRDAIVAKYFPAVNP